MSKKTTPKIKARKRAPLPDWPWTLDTWREHCQQRKTALRASWAKKPPTDVEIVALADAYGKARRAVFAFEWPGDVQRLDEFDRVRCSYESHSYWLDEEKNLARDILLEACLFRPDPFIIKED